MSWESLGEGVGANLQVGPLRPSRLALNHAVRQLTLRVIGDKQVITSGLDGTFFEKLHLVGHTVTELQPTLSQLAP